MTPQTKFELETVVKDIVARYMQEREARINAIPVFSKVEKASLIFIASDARFVLATLHFYAELLDLDADAPPKLKDAIIILKSRFFVPMEAVTHAVPMDVNDFHICAKACEVWLEDKGHRHFASRPRIKEIYDFFIKGRAL